MWGDGGWGNGAAFTMKATPSKYGSGVAEEGGWEGKVPEII
jgi:hypothetical protein